MRRFKQLCTFLLPFIVSIASSVVIAASVDKPLAAHWTFDLETDGLFKDSSANGCDAMLEAGTKPVFIDGLFGKAVSLSGEHKLRVSEKLDSSKFDRITLSVWVRPTSFDRYNEIFRKENGDNRILFSFQEHATVLSLGLNINGNIECDAVMKPEQVLDGSWHHCAATFDGKMMRVYLDGKEIGSAQRQGLIKAEGSAAGYIGSMSGRECFQGAIDDLRIYTEGLTAAEIECIYQEGNKALEKQRAKQLEQLKDIEKQLSDLNATGGSFSEMLANARKCVVEKSIMANSTLAESVLMILKMRYPEDYKDFVRLAGVDPSSYLLSNDPDINAKLTRKSLELCSEYMPLTEAQWNQQSPADVAQWKQIQLLVQKFDNVSKRGESARFSPEWIDIILEAGRKGMIQERPVVREAVAAYITPNTPETRSLNEEESRGVIERDWMHQAGGNPTPQLIRNEIFWARQLADRINVDLRKELKDLDEVETQVANLTSDNQDLYYMVRQIKRRIMFKNPVLDFQKILFVDMPFPSGSEWNHETRHRLGYMAIPGARLLSLDGLSPAGKLTKIMPQLPLHGSFWRPDVSFDGKKILFCFKPHNEKSFHLYEINADGTGLVQLTHGPFDDMDPIYLPDCRYIMFSSTRGHTYVRCMPPTNAYVLSLYDRETKRIYLISRNNEPDYLPSVLNDGRVIYTRWEYTDKPVWRVQGLWSVNPDGTQVNTFWGNQTVWPDLLKDARSIPGSRRIMFTGSAHHNWFSGSIGIIDPDKGFNFPLGLTKVTADVVWPESGNGPVDPVESPNYHPSGNYPAYISPYPLSEKDFLVSANRGGKFMLYLMDVEGNREIIYEGQHNIFHAVPMKARPVPPVLPNKVDWPTEEERMTPKRGVIYSNNVYEGVPEELVGKAKYLRILSIDHKTYTYWFKRVYISTGPVVSGVQSEGVKRILGTVPIEKDGSVAFYAPSGIPMHFQLLDDQHRALQTMRSFTGVMPGETRGCLGCHELRKNAPQNVVRSIATSNEPKTITPLPWGEDTVSYERYVRPVLNQYCSKCHEGDGKGRKKLDMTPRAGKLGFDETYWLFIGNPSWGRPYTLPENPPAGWGIADMIMVEAYDQRDPAAYGTRPPMTGLSYKSRLIELISSGKHHDVKVDPVSRLKMIAWVDTMCPYRGDDEIREIDDPEFQGVDWLAIRPKIKNAPHIVRPGPVE